jgi:hypothetical protein
MAFGHGFGREEEIVRHLNKLHWLAWEGALPSAGAWANALAEFFNVALQVVP